MNVLLEAPPSEQSVHVAVRMPLLLHQLSCCSAGHAMNGIEHHWHGTLAGSRTAYPTCNDAAEGSFHGLSMGVTTMTIVCAQRVTRWMECMCEVWGSATRYGY